MRILYFSRDYTPHDYRFLKSLGKTEHQVGYLRLERRGHQLEDRELPEGIDLIPWVGGKEPARFQDGLRFLIGLLKVIRSYNPDIIHGGPIQRTAFLTALAGFRPLVSMSWGYDLLIDAPRSRWWTWATRFTLKRSAAMVGDCDTVRSLAVSYGMEADRIITFPWGIDLEHFKPIAERPQTGDEHAAESSLRKQLEWDKDKFVLLSTRSWSSLYGVEDLAHAFVRAAHQHPELRLLILGDGPLAPTIRSIFQQGGVVDRVYFPGQVASQDLPGYYQVADLYISTSHSDGTSISLLEALACGTPVLLTDIPGNQEWITNPGEVGWLFRDGDVDALVKGIEVALDQQDQLPGMGDKARQLAESRADWGKNFPKLFEAYKVALGNKYA